MSQTGLLATQSRTWPSSSRLHRSRLRRSNTSCPGRQLLPHPFRWLQCPNLLVAEGGPLRPPLLPRCICSSLQKKRCGAGRRQAAPPVLAPVKPGGERKSKRPRAVFSISGSQEGMESRGWTNTRSHSSSSLASRQQRAVRERHQRPYSRTLCQTMEPGKRCTAHSDPSSVHPRARSLRSTSLPHLYGV